MNCHITWLGQGGYPLEFDNFSLCIDPYLSNSVEEIEGFKRLIPPPITPQELHVSCMLFTHDHLDHFDEPSLLQIQDSSTRYVGPAACMKRMNWIPEERKTTLGRGESLSLGPVTIHAVFAAHTADSVGFVVQDLNVRTGRFPVHPHACISAV